MDFENPEISQDRQALIRKQVQELREKKWVEDFRLIVQELGQEIEKGAGGDLQLSVFEDKHASMKCFEVPQLASLLLRDQELQIQDALGSSLLEVLFLPKDGEFLLQHFADDSIERLSAMREALSQPLELAKTRKKQRTEAVKSRGL